MLFYKLARAFISVNHGVILAVPQVIFTLLESP